MGGDLHEKLIKSRREQSRLICPVCREAFRSPQALNLHREREHKSPPHTDPSVATVVGDAGSNLPGDSPTSRRVSGRTPSENVSQAANAPLSRSATPVKAAAEGTRMRISQLSLEEDGSNLPSPAEFARQIDRVNTASPSKKRPASSEAHGPKPSVPKSSHRSKPRGRGNADPPWNQRPMTSEFQRPRPQSGTLYDPSADQPPKPGQKRTAQGAALYEPSMDDLPMEMYSSNKETLPPGMIRLHGQQQKQLQVSQLSASQTQLQPLPTRELRPNPMSRPQLLAEVKGLYRSLEIVEKRCISLDQAQMAERGSEPTAEHWQALTALHRTLLYEHHDFLLASQHPTAPHEVRRLASERQIPFRMWKYAIHAYLELLRQHLPGSLEFMESFIYLAYQMMALLFETVRLFEDVWTECLGDLARYRMAIENQSTSVRDVWTEVAQYWYSKASDNQPAVGRLYHHLGILARPNLPQQLYYYCKSLCCVTPFPNARHSLKGIFQASAIPAQLPKNADAFRVVDHPFVRMHAVLYDAGSQEDFLLAERNFVKVFHETMPSAEKKWKHFGVLIAIADITACFGYGTVSNPLKCAIERQPQGTGASTQQIAWLGAANGMLASSLQVVLAHSDKAIILPHIHVIFVLLEVLSNYSESCIEALQLLRAMPWTQVAEFLNTIGGEYKLVTDASKTMDVNQPTLTFQAEGDSRPLMEDFAMRGLLWCRNYLPDKWFEGHSNDELPHQEPASAEHVRAKRVFCLGIKVALKTDCMSFDRSTGMFTAGDATRDDDASAMTGIEAGIDT